MNVELVRIGLEDAEKLWKIQIKAFEELFEKYQDAETSPGNEPMEKVKARLAQDFTYYYFIYDEEKTVGAIRVVDMKDGSRKRVSPVFIMKEFRNKGYAQAAFREIERIHGEKNWKLDTILQEKGNCYLYEKLGYVRTGQTEKINERMDIVFYEKD